MTLPLQVKRKVVGDPATTTQQDQQRHDKQLHDQQHHNQQLPVVDIQDDQSATSPVITRVSVTPIHLLRAWCKVHTEQQYSG